MFFVIFYTEYIEVFKRVIMHKDIMYLQIIEQKRSKINHYTGRVDRHIVQYTMNLDTEIVYTSPKF